MIDSTEQKPILMMLLGYPGAGKTFFGRQYSEEKKLPLVSADRLRFELFEDPQYNREEESVVANIMDMMIEEYLKAGLSVVIDGMNSTRTRRYAMRELARKYHANPLAVWVQTDMHTAFHRASNRDRRQTDDKYSRSIDEDTFEQLKKAVKPPQNEDYVVISGKHLFVNQRNAVDKRIQSLKANPRTDVKLGGRVDMTRRRVRRRV